MASVVEKALFALLEDYETQVEQFAQLISEMDSRRATVRGDLDAAKSAVEEIRRELARFSEVV